MLSNKVSFWDFAKMIDPIYFQENNHKLKILSQTLEDRLKNKKLNFIPMEAMKTRRSV